MADKTPNYSISDKFKSWTGLELNMNNEEIGDFGTGFTGTLSTGFKYAAKEKSAAESKAFQNYSNSMTDLSNAINQDSITLNQIQYIDASAQKSQQIQEQYMTATGGTQSAAAAAGVRGNSVQVALTHVEGAAAGAEYNRQRELKYALLGFDQARTTSSLSTAMNKKYSTYSGGSLLESGFSAVQNVSTMLGAIL